MHQKMPHSSTNSHIKQPSLRQHPLRDLLDRELRQGTFATLSLPCRLCHFTLTVASSSRQQEQRLLQQLAEQQGSLLSDSANELNLSLFGSSLRWERHGEFSSYTFIIPGASQPWFDDPLAFLPSRHWFDDVPGQVFRISQLTIIAATELKDSDQLSQLFHQENCISSMLAQGKAQIWTDFQKHAEGSGRMLLVDHGLSPARLSRLVQQLFDLGDYRKLSLLGWPLARQALSQLHQLEQQLSALTHRIGQHSMRDESQLDDIMQLATETEQLIAENSTRLQASVAYYQLTLDRLRSLQETESEGLLSLQDFTERRLTPAFRTCSAVLARQSELSNRLGRATELLRTRINLKLEQQNQQLLRSMEQKARLQLKMQQMVEGLSFVAISYYALQLADKGLQALQYWLPELPLPFWQSLSLPVVLVAVALLLFQARVRLKSH